jgi:hypothetical protein
MGILQEILLFSFLVFSWKQSNVKLFIASQDLYQIILWKVVPYSILHCLSVGSVHLFPSKATYLAQELEISLSKNRASLS